MIKVCFKICYKSDTHYYKVPGHWTMDYFIHKIRDDLCCDFDIDNAFHIIPGPGLQNRGYNGLGEEHPPVEIRHQQTLREYCNPDERNAFYIRFI